MNDGSKKIDLSTYPREKVFKYFNSYANPLWTLNFELKVKNFLPYCVKEKNVFGFQFFLYCLCSAMKDIPEFMMRVRGNELVIHKKMFPSYAVTRKDDSINFAAFEYSDDFSIFMQRSLEAKKKAEDINDIVSEGEKSDYYVFLTHLSWMSFHSFQHPVMDFKNFSIPSFAFGKYIVDGKWLKISTSVQTHHALVDGIHIQQLIKKTNEKIDFMLSSK